MKKILFLFLLGLNIICIKAKDCVVIGDNKPGSSESNVSFPLDKKKVEIPFTLDANHIQIPITINGKGPFNFTFDTGMPMDSISLFQSPKTDGISFTAGTGGGPGIAENLSIKIGDIEIKGVTAMVMPSPGASIFTMDGIIGYTIFSRFVVEIDNNRNVIILSKPEDFVEKSNLSKVPISIKHHFPFVKAEVELLNGKQIPVELIIDLGASHALALNPDNPDMVHPEKTISNKVRGMGFMIDVFTGRVKSFTLGKFKVNNLLANFMSKKPIPDETDGNLGNWLLRRFNLIINYSRNSIYLEPSKQIDDPFEMAMTGVRASKSNQGNFVVRGIIPDSPASEAGLKEKDEIFEINGMPTSKLSDDDFILICSKVGETVNFSIKRGSETIKAALKMRRLI